MKRLQIVVSKIYWVIVAAVPFYPWYELFALQNELACAYGTPCFEHGLPYQLRGSMAGITTGIILWPICIWKLGGSHLWNYVKKLQSKA